MDNGDGDSEKNKPMTKYEEYIECQKKAIRGEYVDTSCISLTTKVAIILKGLKDIAVEKYQEKMKKN